MSKRTIEVACPRCGENNQKDLDKLDPTVEIYRDNTSSQQKVYSFACRACGAPLKVTLTEKE